MTTILNPSPDAAISDVVEHLEAKTKQQGDGNYRGPAVAALEWWTSLVEPRGESTD